MEVAVENTSIPNRKATSPDFPGKEKRGGVRMSLIPTPKNKLW